MFYLVVWVKKWHVYSSKNGRTEVQRKFSRGVDIKEKAFNLAHEKMEKSSSVWINLITKENNEIKIIKQYTMLDIKNYIIERK